MIQDIAPKVFDNQYKNMAADGSAYIIYASGDEVLLKEDKGELFVPKLHELSGRPFALVNKNWTLKLYFFTYNLRLLYSRICFSVLLRCQVSE